MSLILVDSSVWIDYFRGSGEIDADRFEGLIDTNQICTNELILAELIPVLSQKGQSEVIQALKSVKVIPLTIVWPDIIDLQFMNLKSGINKIGIPDLIILQNVIQNGLSLFTLDSHFQLMKQNIEFRLLEK
ncbi:MAG: PIN domain-containing protein [Bacteroidetes bacterium]|nr:PIN domain-containing protein [Bacteroidota bacterium]